MRTGGLFRRNTVITAKRDEDFADYATVISSEVIIPSYFSCVSLIEMISIVNILNSLIPYFKGGPKEAQRVYHFSLQGF